jgi:hypothetical protein
MPNITRRDFLRTGAALGAAGLLGAAAPFTHAYAPGADEVPHGKRPAGDKSVEVLHPRNRVPLSFIIDDSTCLVNMGKYCMPQFNAAAPQNPIYWKKWKSWPDAIPDDFVREFGEFCASQGVRGKYSLVPYPACVGWLDRDLPGWSRKELKESLKLVNELMVPSWDITPEMVTHTRVIDIKTGRALEPANAATMENSYPPEKKSADELAAYIAYALRILKNAEIPATGVTTPGGFGNKCKAELSLAMRQALADVFAPEIPFYFKYIVDGKEDTRPRLEHVEGAETDSPKFVANVPAGTGDWFGGWDGDRPPEDEKYVNADGTGGRMVELIERGEPAIMFGHWAGFYGNGSKNGLEACKRVITTINGKYRDRTIWMKTSELARYQAARELTRINRNGNQVSLDAPFACPAFTLRLAAAPGGGPPKVMHEGKPLAMAEAASAKELKAGTWLKQADGAVQVCFDLPKGKVTFEG